MGTSRTTAQLSAKLERLADAFDDLDATVVREAAQITKQTITAGAPARLRGVGRRGARISVGYTVTTTAVNPAALVFARGPWQFIEFDTEAHDEPRQRARRRGTTKRRVVVVPGYGPRAHAHHPGTTGKHPFGKGVDRARPLAARVMVHRSEAVLRAVF